ncbi:MAG: hypothetical protein FWF21_12835 [Micrococcales bacterium]|nr:hypothetical protein [Micrococcales bacterium]
MTQEIGYLGDGQTALLDGVVDHAAAGFDFTQSSGQGSLLLTSDVSGNGLAHRGLCPLNPFGLDLPNPLIQRRHLRPQVGLCGIEFGLKVGGQLGQHLGRQLLGLPDLIHDGLDFLNRQIRQITGKARQALLPTVQPVLAGEVVVLLDLAGSLVPLGDDVVDQAVTAAGTLDRASQVMAMLAGAFSALGTTGDDLLAFLEQIDRDKGFMLAIVLLPTVAHHADVVRVVQDQGDGFVG